jgi:heme-degrading monooxygenase HmoA
MFLEIAQVDVRRGQEAEFEAGVAKAAPLFKRAKGCRAMSLQRCAPLSHFAQPHILTNGYGY